VPTLDLDGGKDEEYQERVRRRGSLLPFGLPLQDPKNEMRRETDLKIRMRRPAATFSRETTRGRKRLRERRSKSMRSKTAPSVPAIRRAKMRVDPLYTFRGAVSNFKGSDDDGSLRSRVAICVAPDGVTIVMDCIVETNRGRGEILPGRLGPSRAIRIRRGGSRLKSRFP